MNLKRLILALFFASGFCGLVYEVVWMRDLTLLFGSTVYAASTILAAFMGGLALGSYVFGRITDRHPNPLRLYGILEILIGIAAILFPFCLDALTPLYIWTANSLGLSHYSLSLFRAVLIIVVLIPPTGMMGGTLPLLASHLSRRPESAGWNLSLLYGWNTLGAVLGCSLTGFVLIGILGVRATTFVAVFLNIAIGLVALRLSRGQTVPEAKEEPEEPAAKAPDKTKGGTPLPAWYPKLLLGMFVAAGVTALAYEVLWMRVLIFVIGNTTYAFTSVLTTYLCGLALGSLAISRFIDRSHRLLETFGVIQIVVGAGVLVTLLCFPMLLNWVGGLLFEDGQYIHGRTVSFFLLQGGISFVYIFPFTLLMGMTFPIMMKLYGVVRQRVGSGAGTAYFADTAGAILGSMASGFVLIPLIGTLRSLELMCLVNMLIGGIALAVQGDGGGVPVFVRRKAQVNSVCIVVATLFCTLLIPRNTFAPVFTAAEAKLDYLNEDIGGTVTIENYGTHRTISINGVNVAGTDLKFKTTQKLQAHFALLLHPDPRKVLQIGFGSGGTAWSIARHPVEEIDCVELTQAVIDARVHFEEESNHGILEDPRVHVTIDDARSYLVRTDERYDAILSDSIHPRGSGNGGLYSVDYFRLCRHALKDDGIFSAWLPIHGLSLEGFQVIVRSLKEVFPHVYLFHSPMGRTEWTIIIGTNHPLQIHPENFEKRRLRPDVKQDLDEIRFFREEDLLSTFILGDKNIGAFLGDSRDLNTDDFPYLEYVEVRADIGHSRKELFIPAYQKLIETHEPIFAYLEKPLEQGTTTLTNAVVSSVHTMKAMLHEFVEGYETTNALAEIHTALEIDPDNQAAQMMLEEPRGNY